MQQHNKKLIIGISGASGAIYGYNLLKIIATLDHIESHLIITKSAHITIKTELGIPLSEFSKLATIHYKIDDIAASISSGSFITDGMIIAPCSVKTLANIATGNSDNLLCRAADVILKERRKLVLMLRETPLSLIHIENMKKVTEAGAIIAPPVPAFYNHPKDISDIVFHSVARILDLFDLNLKETKRWQG
jgi:flavin prenyltransferase